MAGVAVEQPFGSVSEGLEEIFEQRINNRQDKVPERQRTGVGKSERWLVLDKTLATEINGCLHGVAERSIYPHCYDKISHIRKVEQDLLEKLSDAKYSCSHVRLNVAPQVDELGEIQRLDKLLASVEW